MKPQFNIKQVMAREILDSRGNPTVEATVVLNNGVRGVAAVPSGASTGEHEAVELRDKDPKRYGGKGVRKAVANVNLIIDPLLRGVDVRKQKKIDQLMIDLDETPNKAFLGANAILGVSLACARAAAEYKNLPLYSYIAKLHGGEPKKYRMPIPSFNVINGGQHADNSIDFQEFMIFPSGIRSFEKRVQAGAEIFHALKKLLAKKKHITTVGDEGGFAPNFTSNKKALDFLTKAVEQTQWELGKDIFFAMDPAASEFYENEKYQLNGEAKPRALSRKQMINYWGRLVDKYPLVSIEDPLDENDWEGWADMTKQLGKKIQVVGDDFLVTNPKRIKQAIEQKAANAALIKVNQIGTLSETLEAIKLAQDAKWKIMVSHRSGETTDTFIADLVVGVQAEQIKSGSLSRGERLVKYNRLLEIDQELRASKK